MKSKHVHILECSHYSYTLFYIVFGIKSRTKSRRSRKRKKKCHRAETEHTWNLLKYCCLSSFLEQIFCLFHFLSAVCTHHRTIVDSMQANILELRVEQLFEKKNCLHMVTCFIRQTKPTTTCSSEGFNAVWIWLSSLSLLLVKFKNVNFLLCYISEVSKINGNPPRICVFCLFPLSMQPNRFNVLIEIDDAIEQSKRKKKRDIISNARCSYINSIWSIYNTHEFVAKPFNFDDSHSLVQFEIKRKSTNFRILSSGRRYFTLHLPLDIFSL